MQEYTIPRDEQRPLRFLGDVVVESRGALVAGRDQNRYYHLTLYRTEDVRILVHWEYTTMWQGELCHSAVEVYSTVAHAIEALEGFDPAAWIIGYKPQLTRGEASAEHYRPRQEALERTITEHYRRQVADLCQQLGLVEDLA